MTLHNACRSIQCQSQAIMDDPATLVGKSKGLHIAHLNVRSMLSPNTFDLLLHQIKYSGVEIFTLSETWLNCSIPTNLIKAEGYEVTRLDRNWTSDGHNLKKGGGLACYVRKGLKYSDTKHENLNISCRDLEMQWVSINLANVRPIVVVNIYRPPQGDYKECCNLITEAFMNANLKDNTEIYLLGDFNINYDDKKSSTFRELDFTTRALGLTQLICEPTRVTFREGVASETKIDLVFSNSEIISCADVLNINISDHKAVMVTRKKKHSPPTKVKFKGRSYKNYVKEDFQESLTETNWEDFYTLRDPNLLWEFMENIILSKVDQVCPLKTFNVNNSREPWITNGRLRQSRIKIDYLHGLIEQGKRQTG